jgi:hypothetical protein
MGLSTSPDGTTEGAPHNQRGYAADSTPSNISSSTKTPAFSVLEQQQQIKWNKIDIDALTAACVADMTFHFSQDPSANLGFVAQAMDRDLVKARLFFSLQLSLEDMERGFFDLDENDKAGALQAIRNTVAAAMLVPNFASRHAESVIAGLECFPPPEATKKKKGLNGNNKQ